MNSPIQGLSSSPLLLPQAPAGAEGATGTSFKDFLLDSLGEVNSMQLDANKAVEALATGGDVSPGEVMTAVQKADLAFRMMMQIRNKLVSAYQDVQNIRV
ncbi:MAG TPA: flagellar hook-basal body complex protein FliE [Pirellulales bacterium]|jgi:flagellar hook-basal body complex protein FliE|nr:flagellar hook-basal body complex protein FliE [Pirellulales bacterium]